MTQGNGSWPMSLNHWCFLWLNLIDGTPVIPKSDKNRYASIFSITLAIKSVGRSFGLAYLRDLQACFGPFYFDKYCQHHNLLWTFGFPNCMKLKDWAFILHRIWVNPWHQCSVSLAVQKSHLKSIWLLGALEQCSSHCVGEFKHKLALLDAC